MLGGGLLGSSGLTRHLTNRTPNKHNAKCRHHIPKMKFSVRNWAEYDAALRARGSMVFSQTHSIRRQSSHIWLLVGLFVRFVQKPATSTKSHLHGGSRPNGFG
jgi:hypothetical protein